MRTYRRLVGIAFAAVVAAVAAPASAQLLNALSDRWHGAADVDPMTDTNRFIVAVVTMNVNGTPFSNQFARVKLVCADGKATLGIDWSFKVAGKANLTVEYRFEGRPGRTLGARYVNRTEQRTTDIADIRRFLADAVCADSLRVRVQSDLGGLAEATFRTRGGQDMAAKFTRACPVAALQ